MRMRERERFQVLLKIHTSYGHAPQLIIEHEITEADRKWVQSKFTQQCLGQDTEWGTKPKLSHTGPDRTTMAALLWLAWPLLPHGFTYSHRHANLNTHQGHKVQPHHGVSYLVIVSAFIHCKNDLRRHPRRQEKGEDGEVKERWGWGYKM